MRMSALAGLGASGRFDPVAALFLDGGKGALLSSAVDLANYQTAAGVTLAGFGDPVGLALDTKNGVPAPAGPGAHFSQSVLADRPTRGRQPRTGVQNLADQAAQIGASPWIGASGGGETITLNNRPDLSGAMRMTRIVSDGLANRGASLSVTVPNGIAGKTITVAVDVYAETEFTFAVRTRGEGATQEAVNSTLTTVPGQTVRLHITRSFTGSADGSTFRLFLYTAAFNVNNANTIWFGRCQAEVGGSPTAFQDRVTINDITEAGVPDVAHMRGNGVNQNSDGNDTARAILRDAPGAEAHWAIIWEGGANAWLWFYSRNGGNEPRFALRINADGSLTAQVRRADGDATTTVSTAAGAITENVRTIVGLSVDYLGGGASAITIWVNGVAVATGELTGTGNTSDTLSDRVRIFSNAADTEYLKGFLLRELPLTARLWTPFERNTVIPRMKALTGVSL